MTEVSRDAGHHDHDTDTRRAGLTRRVNALEAVLVREGVVTSEQVDTIIEVYTERLGPQHGARLIARAWTDPAFKQRLLTDATAVVREQGYDGAGGTHRELPFLELRVVENTPDVHNVIVCTLCSCYPLSLLGPQPAWYKSPEYRARMVVEPRAVLAELGLEVAPEVTLRVWDSTAETRYMVMPQRPPGTEGQTAEELAHLVSRDAMVGVALASG